MSTKKKQGEIELSETSFIPSLITSNFDGFITDLYLRVAPDILITRVKLR